MARRKHPIIPGAPYAIPLDLSHQVVSEERAGEIVTLKGERGSTYTILREVLNVVNGAEWVEMVGGASGHKEYRTPSPDRVIAKRRRRA